jgi:hypothetical protein
MSLTILEQMQQLLSCLQLANDVLGGTKTPGVNGVPSYSDVNEAVSTINEAFDEGRRFLNYYDTKQTCESLFPPAALPTGAATTTVVSAYRESVGMRSLFLLIQIHSLIISIRGGNKTIRARNAGSI